MKLLPTIALSAGIAIISASAGFAQGPATTAPSTAATKPAVATPAAAKPTSAEKAAISETCSEQADAKNLHGKERKKFRAKCKRSGGKPS